MLQLKDLPPIGSGVDRIVYPHPQQAGLCIKIAKYGTARDIEVKDFRDRLFLITRLGSRDQLDYNFTDVRYAEKLERRNGPDIFNHLPRCYGFVETDLGQGVVWEHITNFDGSPCLSLKDCKQSPGQLGESENDMLWAALLEFFSWQTRNAIMLREMAYSNTLVKQVAPGSIRLYHIDAIGCVDLIPIAAYSQTFARLRVMSKVSRFKNKMVKWLGPPNTTE